MGEHRVLLVWCGRDCSAAVAGILLAACVLLVVLHDGRALDSHPDGCCAMTLPGCGGVCCDVL